MKIKPAYIIFGVIAALIAVLALPRLFATQPGATSNEGSVIKTAVTAADTNADVTYQLALLEGSDAEHESSHVFEAIQGLQGVGEVEFDTNALTLKVNYDDAVIGDSIIYEALLASGYLVPTSADATPAELAEDGSVQRISIFDDGIQFDPYLIGAAAGVPLEIEFSPGQECRVSVSFPDLGIGAQDISQGGVVALPAMEPGEYAIICSGGGLDGKIFVE
jgi:copper chaperone CopZ